MHGQLATWTAGCIHGQLSTWTGGHIDSWSHGRLARQMGSWTNEQLDKWAAEQLGARQIDNWTNGQLVRYMGHMNSKITLRQCESKGESLQGRYLSAYYMSFCLSGNPFNGARVGLACEDV